MAKAGKLDNNTHNLLNSMVEARAWLIKMRIDQVLLTEKVKQALDYARNDRSGTDIYHSLIQNMQDDVETYTNLNIKSPMSAKTHKLKELATLALESFNGEVEVSKWHEEYVDTDLPTLTSTTPSEGSLYSFGPDDRYWGTPKSTVWTYLCCQLLNVTKGELPHSQVTNSILYTIDTGSTEHADNAWLHDGVLTVPHSGYTFGGTRYTHPEEGPKLYGNPAYSGGESYDCSSWVGMWTTNRTPTADDGVSSTTIDLTLTYSRQSHGLPSSWDKWQAEENNLRLKAAYTPVESLAEVKPGMVYVYNKAWNPVSPVEVADVSWKHCSGHTGMVVNLYPDTDGTQKVNILSANRSYEQGLDGIGYQSGFAAKASDSVKPCYLSANYAVESNNPQLVRDLTNIVISWDGAKQWGDSETQTLIGVIDSVLDPIE